MSVRPKTQVDQDHVNQWKVCATTIRFARAVLDILGDAKRGSAIAQIDKSLAVHHEYLSDSVVSALNAAIDNLHLWANTVLPQVFIEDHPVENPLRPYSTLARAGLESAAQAAWILLPKTRDEIIDRHLRLAVNNLEELGKSLRVTNPEQKHRIDEHIAQIRASHGSPVKLAPSYCDMIRAAAPTGDMDPDQAEVLWRTASAATHGKQWFISATHSGVRGEEFAPGQFRAEYVPDPEKITQLITFASQVTERTLMRYADLAGVDLTDLASQGLMVVSEMRPRAMRVVDA